MQAREAAVRVALSQRGVHEVGRANWGPQVKKYLAATGLNFPAAWCMAFVAWVYEQNGVRLDRLGLMHEASVGYMAEFARRQGWTVKRPLRGDIGCWDLTGDGWGDHVFIVTRVLSLGPGGWLVRTIEGNTSPGNDGSQDNGDGVYERTRFIRRGDVTWVRVPGLAKPNGFAQSIIRTELKKPKSARPKPVKKVPKPRRT